MYVYILKCSDSSYYTGVTNNLERRFSEHQEGRNPKCYTFKRRPVSLVFSERFASPSDAIRLEKRIKSWTRAKKEALITGRYDEIHELAKCKNETSHLNFKAL